MHSIQIILDACKSVKPNDTPAAANRKIMPIAHEFCKHHPFNDELILIVSIRGLKPLLYSYSYNFSITNLHSVVKSSLGKARKSFDADIVVLEWFPSKKAKLPYYCHMVA